MDKAKAAAKKSTEREGAAHLGLGRGADSVAEAAKEREGESEESGSESGSEGGEGAGAEAAKPMDARAKKLAELRAKLNEARSKNHAAVLGEHKAQSVAPSRLSEKQRVEQAAWLAKVDRIRGEAEARGEDAEVYAMRSMTAEEAEAETKRELKKKSGVFGWEVYSNDAHYRAHKKRTAGLVADDGALSWFRVAPWGVTVPLSVECSLAPQTSTRRRRRRRPTSTPRRAT